MLAELLLHFELNTLDFFPLIVSELLLHTLQEEFFGESLKQPLDKGTEEVLYKFGSTCNEGS